jgi:hypothetical protein
MKAYTDIEQSKKLAEFLPLESADMFWYRDAVTTEVNPRIMNYTQVPKLQSMYYSPCWSLTALLNAIPQEIFCGDYVINITEGRLNKWVLTYDHCVNRNHSNYGLSSCADTLVDACVEMIVKLHEQKLL